MVKPGNANLVTPEGGISQSAADARYVQKAGDTMSGPLNMGGQSVTSVNVASATTGSFANLTFPYVSGSGPFPDPGVGKIVVYRSSSGPAGVYLVFHDPTDGIVAMEFDL
jgi:hypothetical protein